MSLKRFHDAQKSVDGYDKAFRELKQGQKTSHWIWYIFPQLKSLGYSSTAKLYGISDFDEACDYLRDPVLFKRYLSIVQLVEQQVQKIPLVTLMGGTTDAGKLTSSITLFQAAAAYLNSKSGEPGHDYKELEQSCSRIFKLIANQSYHPCKQTLTVVPNTVKQTDTKKPAKKETTTSSTLFAPVKKVPVLSTDSAILQELAEYKNIRTNEWGFHYNFLGIVSMLYYIQDMLLGTDHFNSKSREIKISAASKLEKILDPSCPKTNPLTETEQHALKDGRLGAIVNRHGGLDQLLQNAAGKLASDNTSDTGYKL